MGIKNKSLLFTTAIAGILTGGVAFAAEQSQIQVQDSVTNVVTGEQDARLGGDLGSLLLAASEDSGGGDFGGVLGLPAQPPEGKRPFSLEKGDLLFRMRFIDIMPNDSNGAVKITPYGTVSGSKLSFTGATGFEGDVTYILTPNIGFELSLESSTHLLKDNNGKLAGATGLGSNLLGSTSMLPMTATAQYRFMPKSTIHPYVGLGLNYTLFNNEESGLSGVSLNVDNTFGVVVQFGVDVGIHEKWFLNADMKYINMSSTMNLSNPSSGVTDKTDLQISPWILGLGLGTYF